MLHALRVLPPVRLVRTCGRGTGSVRLSVQRATICIEMVHALDARRQDVIPDSFALGAVHLLTGIVASLCSVSGSGRRRWHCMDQWL